MVTTKGGEEMDIEMAILIGLIIGPIVGACICGGIIYAGLQLVADATKKKK